VQSKSAKSDVVPHARRAHRRLRLFLWIIAAWATLAYLVAPRLWELYFHNDPDYAQVPRVTHAADEHPGDPINIALVGSEAEVTVGMRAAGWFPAHALGFESDVRIAADSVMRRADDDAPVSNLFLFDRKQDLAFELPVPGGPGRRSHVRYWQWDKTDGGRPVWFGAASFDERVGLSYTTGQVTHHIGPDVDAERDRIAKQLSIAGCVLEARSVDDFQQAAEGRNGGGDAWRTDRKLIILELRQCDGPASPH
jgi:LssY-like putative type I secretion system component LssY